MQARVDPVGGNVSVSISKRLAALVAILLSFSLIAAACGDDPELLRDVEELIRCDAELPESFPVPELAAEAVVAAMPSTALEGTRFGRYRLRERIGEGGMGVVHRAEQDSSERTVALKILRPEAGSEMWQSRS